MVDVIKSWFAAPKLTGDEEQDRRASLLNTILNFSLGFVALVVIGNLLESNVPLRNFEIDALMLAACLGLRYALLRGRLTLVSVGVLLAGYLSIALSTASEGSILAPVSVDFLILVLVAGLLFKGRGVLVSVLVSSLTILGLILAENAGLLPAPQPIATLLNWFTFTLALAVSGALTVFAFQSTLLALQRSKKEVKERELAEQALAESRIALDAIVDSTSDLICAVDPETFGLLTFNQSLRNYFLKFRHIEIQPGMTPEVLFENPGYVQIWNEFFRRALSEGSFTSEFDVFTGTIFLELTFHLLKRDGKVFGISVFGKDITPRRQAEAALRENKQRLELALKGSNAGLWDWDIRSGNEFINARYAEMLGYSLEELEPLTMEKWQSLCHPDDLPANLRELERHLSGESGFYTAETRMKHKNGGWVWVLHSGQVTEWDESGQPVRMSGTHIDISASKQAEAALRESEDLFRSFIEQSPLGQILSDDKGMCIAWNSALEKLTGIPASEALGNNSWDIQFRFLPPQQRTEEMRARLKSIQAETVDNLRKGLPVNVERLMDIQMVSTSGENRLVQQVFFPIKMHTGFGFGVSIQDVTLQRENEAILKKRLELMEFANQHTLKELMQKALDETETMFSSPISFLHMLDAEGKTVQSANYSTRTEQEYCQMDSSLLEHRPLILAGVWAEAARQRQPLIHNDYAGLEKKKGLPEGHAPLQREMVIPVMRAGQVVAVLGLGNKPTDYSEHDLLVATRFADYVVDIVERKQAETEVQRLLEIIETAQDFIGSSDPNGRMTYLNPLARRMLGIPAGAPLAEYNLSTFLTPQSYELLTEQAMPEAGLNGFWSGESAIQNLEGRVFPVLESLVAHRDASGQISHYSAIINDISALKHTEAALRQSNETTHAILNATTESAFLIEPDGTVVAANQPGAERVGLELSALIGMNTYADILPPALAASRKALLDEVVRSGKPTYFEDENSGRWFANSVYPVFNPEAQVTRLAIYSRDVTETRQAQAELLRYRDHLEALVQERTAQLEQARDEADNANRAKSDFLAVMSHEIRTPMSGVLGLTHLVLQTNLDEKQRDYMRRISASGESLLEIINDILDFSKIEAGKLEVESIDFDLDDVLHSLANLIALRAQEKGLELVFNTAPDVPRRIIGDPSRLRQVLLNLVGNAVKFTETGEVVVKVEMIKNHYNSLTLEFSVRDTGIGMESEKLSSLFQAFSQVDSSTSRKFGGTGLGLVISQRLVGMMGGEIRVESRKDQGSTFSFSLPVQLQTRARARSLAVTPDLRGLRVLAMDDNAEALSFVKAILTSLTFKVKTTSSAREALSWLLYTPAGRDHFDLLVLDESMPDGLDGLQIIREIRRVPELEYLPIILLLPREDDDEAEAYALGANSVLIKPTTSSSLFDAVMQVFGHPNKPQAWRKPETEEPESLAAVHGRRILLVEDDETNQLVAQTLLEGAGLSLDIASNGAQGVEMASQGNYDALLMDIQMPGMDGFEAVSAIRAKGGQFEYDQLPIIAMTAHALEGDREKILASGFNDYVAKPVDVNLLHRVLLKWLKPATDEAAGPAAPSGYAKVKTIKTAIKRGRPAAADRQAREGLLDRHGALERLGFNQPLYTRLLQEVFKNHANTAKVIEKAIQEKDIPRAHRMAHALKGVAGQIGATDLREASLQLELALANQNEPQYAGCLDQVKHHLAAILPILKAANKE